MSAANKRVVFYILTAAVLVLVATLAYKYRIKIGHVLMPFLLAIPIVYIVRPIARRLERKGLKIGASILAVYLFFVMAFLALALFLIPELMNNAKDLADKLPDIMRQIQDTFNGFIAEIKYSNWSEGVKDIILKQIEGVFSIMEKYAARVLEKTIDAAAGAATMVIDVSIAMFIAYYYIKDEKLFIDLFLSLLPQKWRNGARALLNEIGGIMSKFISGQLLISLIVALLETVGLIIVGVKYPLIMGLIGGIFNIIPYFGPIIGALPAVALAFMESPLKALWTVLVFIVVQQMENTFIAAKIVEGKLGLHPVATVFAVLAGAEFFGLWGMMLAVPVAAALRAAVRMAVDAIS
jgi:predicted PurR-regulated permease PerM